MATTTKPSEVTDNDGVEIFGANDICTYTNHIVATCKSDTLIYAPIEPTLSYQSALIVSAYSNAYSSGSVSKHQAMRMGFTHYNPDNDYDDAIEYAMWIDLGVA